MTEFLDAFLSIGTYLIIPSFLAGFVGVFVFSGSDDDNPIIRRKAIKYGRILIGQLLLCILTLFSVKAMIEFSARKELTRFLNQEKLTLKINKCILPEDSAKAIINELKYIADLKSHHSSPQKKINIEIISSNETIRLTLGQDSEIETEYWIFWDKYEATNENEFGRINTKIFE